MTPFPLTIPASASSPALHIHTNQPHNLYHYLLKQAQLRATERLPETAEAASLMAQARNVHGPQGIWNIWEEPLSSARTVQEAIAGLRAAMARTVEQIEEALTQSESSFRETLWPERTPLLEAAYQTIQEYLAPHFADMARRQGEQLGLVWPESIDAYLVTDLSHFSGAYSHPLTLDIARNTGLTLCETILHEATHVSDVYMMQSGKESFKDRLMAHLMEKGFQFSTAWNVWHALIFVASAQQVRTFIDADYIDYALSHNLYAYFGVLNLPAVWTRLISGEIDESAFLYEVTQQLK